MKMRDSVGEETLKLDIEATNNGNTDITPSAKLTVQNLQMQTLEELETSNFGTISPNTTQTLTAEFTSKLTAGEYFGEASVLVDGKVVRKERLVFRINDKKGGINNVRENSLVSQVSAKVKGNLLPIGAIVVASSVLFVIVKKFLGKKAIAFISKRRKIIFFVVSVILVALVLWLFSQNTLTKRQSNTNNSSTQTQTKQDVKGASITLEQNTNKEDNKQLIVSDKSWGGGYPIYSEPDKKSAILLISKDGDKFDVIEERSGWYLVSLSNGSGGWLEKTSVKQIDTK